jgi:hypothetical protein
VSDSDFHAMASLIALIPPAVEPAMPPRPMAKTMAAGAKVPQSVTNMRPGIVAKPVPVCAETTWKIPRRRRGSVPR